ncbi:MAG: hypothetical protein Q9171_007129 [Xanthocarpia ochracea]
MTKGIRGSSTYLSSSVVSTTNGSQNILQYTLDLNKLSTKDPPFPHISKMPSNGIWEFQGSHKQSRQYDPKAAPQPRPTQGEHSRPELQAEYVLNHKPPGYSESLIIRLIFSAHASPYTVTGTATGVYCGQVSKFDMEGTGTVDIEEKGPEVWQRGGEIFRAKFSIVTDSGTERYEGISGSGELCARIFEQEDAYVTHYGYVLREGSVRGYIDFENIINGGT